MQHQHIVQWHQVIGPQGSGKPSTASLERVQGCRWMCKRKCIGRCGGKNRSKYAGRVTAKSGRKAVGEAGRVTAKTGREAGSETGGVTAKTRREAVRVTAKAHRKQCEARNQGDDQKQPIVTVCSLDVSSQLPHMLTRKPPKHRVASPDAQQLPRQEHRINGHPSY